MTTSHGTDEPAPPWRGLAKPFAILPRQSAFDRLLAARTHNWRVERMAVIDRLVLRMAVFELLTAPETPPKVVINEAIELTRTFSGEEAVPFVNGVLDGVRKDLAATDTR